MMKKLTSVVLGLALAGCMSMGTMVDLDKVATLKKGVSTEADAIALLGPPTTVSSYGDNKVIAYSGTESHATSPFTASVKSVYVMLQFKDGVLNSVTTSTTKAN
jgi:hypothetical protein